MNDKYAEYQVQKEMFKSYRGAFENRVNLAVIEKRYKKIFEETPMLELFALYKIEEITDKETAENLLSAILKCYGLKGKVDEEDVANLILEYYNIDDDMVCDLFFSCVVFFFSHMYDRVMIEDFIYYYKYYFLQ